MAEVIRPLSDNEKGVFIPAREIMEPEASQVTRAVANYVGNLVSDGVKEQSGEVLVRVNDRLQVSAAYSVNTKTN